MEESLFRRVMFQLFGTTPSAILFAFETARSTAAGEACGLGFGNGNGKCALIHRHVLSLLDAGSGRGKTALGSCSTENG